MTCTSPNLHTDGGNQSPESARYDARELIRDGVKADIVLDDQTYTLRITKAGKLILTK